MRPPKNDLESCVLRDLFDYDPQTGLFTAIGPQGVGFPKTDAGSFGGWKNRDGYLQFRVGGRMYQAHRLAWLHFYGDWPKHCIDHINGCRADNRIENLRDVHHGVNQQNKRSASRNSTTGLLGVTRERGGYKAQITFGGSTKYLGRFATAEEAHARYVEVKRQVHEGGTL